MSTQGNGWNEYQLLVLDSLKRHDALLQSLNNKVNKIHIEIAYLKVKSGLWGLVAGAIPFVVAFLVNYAKGG